MAGGIANTTNLANSIRELYYKPFVNLRDTTNTFLKRIPKKTWPKKTIDTLIRDAYYTPVWSVALRRATPQADRTAAEFFNRCRARGIQGSNTDFLICAAAVRRRLSIFTADEDFAAFAQVLPLRFHRRPA